MSVLLGRMHHEGGTPLRYELAGLDLTSALGRTITLRHTGQIFCLHCGNQTNKSFGDGLCYPCFTTLARADSCIIRPHTCHFAAGTCREPDWGRAHCLVPHVAYLAITSGLKVGVTGDHKVAERWGDQGAVAALVLARTPDRLTAGRIEVALAQHVSDRTNWRHLITGRVEETDLPAARTALAEKLPGDLKQHLADDDAVTRLDYPIQSFPDKARTVNLDKQLEVTGVLTGIKGQYLFVGGYAFNVRRHGGYQVELQLSA